MSTAPQSVSFIGRQDTIRQVMERFQRPDDLRNNPNEFVQPGFYSLAGTGKSRLLDEVANQASLITPYVVKLNFDVRSDGVTPNTPLNLATALIDLLEDKDRRARPFWQKAVWRWRNPFKGCRRIIEQIQLTNVSQTVNVLQGQASNIRQNISLDSQIPQNLSQSFAEALRRLHTRSQTKVLFGKVGEAPRLPLIMVILDTVERASRPIREWLPQMRGLPGGQNTLYFHFMYVLASRSKQPGATESLLPPLESEDAKEFIREYARYLLRDPKTQIHAETLRQLIDVDAAQARLAEQGRGIPLLLQVLTKTTALSPTLNLAMNDTLPAEQEACTQFVIENYLKRLREQAFSQQDDQIWRHYYLLLYSSVPRRIPGSYFLREFLKGLPGTQFGEQTNYDELFEELLQEAFVEQNKDGSLVMHSLIRDGIKAYLQDGDPKTLELAHTRTAEWFQRNQDRINYFYHALRSDFAQAFPALRSTMEQAIQQGKWSELPGLIGTTTGLPMGEIERGWINFYKADLAWAEHNSGLALERLRKLYGEELAASVGEQTAARLEQWVGFSSTMSAQLENESETVPFAGNLPDLLWWSRYRKVPVVEARVLKLLGIEAAEDERFDEAQTLFTQSLEIFKRLDKREACARLCDLLGTLKLQLGLLSEAEALLAQARDLYAENGRTIESARIESLRSIVVFYQGGYEEAQQQLNQTLERQKELGDLPGQARTLQSLGQMKFLVQGTHESEATGEMLRNALRLYTIQGNALGQAQALTALADLQFAMLSEQSPLISGVDVRQTCLKAAKAYEATKDHLGAARIQFVLGILAGMRIYDFDEQLLGPSESHIKGIEAAVEYFSQAGSFYRKANDHLSWAHMETIRGAVLYTLWERHESATESAYAALNDAMELYQKAGDETGQASVRLVLGQISLGDQEYARAQEHFEETAVRFSSIDSDFGRIMLGCAQMFLDRVEKKLGPCDKSEIHILFVARCRMMGLFGWNKATFREWASPYTIFQIKETAEPRQSLRHVLGARSQ